jgi:hypothetical protein
LEIDLEKIRLYNSIDSFSYLDIKRKEEIAKNELLLKQFDDKILLKSRLKFDNFSRTISQKNGRNSKYSLIIAAVHGVVIYELSFFSYLVLNSFIEVSNVNDVINKLYLSHSGGVSEHVFISLTISQIKEGMKSGVLVVQKDN